MSQSKDFQLGSSIPVIRMFDEEKTRAFYVDFLGFSIDWEHRFSETSPLYLQVSHGESVIHLNGHAEPEAPTTEVRIPVTNIESYVEFLAERSPASHKPSLVDARETGSADDMNIYDPSGNHLVFWRSEKAKPKAP